MRHRTGSIALALLVGLAVFAGSFLVYRVLLDEQRSSERTFIQSKLGSIAATLSQSVNVRLNHTRSLAAFVELNPDFTQRDFDRYTDILAKDLVGLRSLQLAPDGVVRYVTNLEWNRAALGHDLFGDAKRRHMVEQAVRERRYIIAGPIDLIQGGKAIIARRPIFRPAGGGAAETFWGFATVLIDVEPLLTDAGFFELEKTLRLAIRGKDGLGAKGEVFYGDPATFDAALATTNVVLPGGTWQIGAALAPVHDHSGFYIIWLYLTGGALLALLSSIMTFVLADRPRRLQEAVDRATAELQDAIAAAEQANRAKTEFLGTMSHELRTPLTSIAGSLGLIRGGVLGTVPAKAQQLLDIADQNAKRLGDLIDDVLDLQKIEAGQMEFVMEPVDANALLDRAVAANATYGARFGVTFHVTQTVDDASVHGDADRLMQVFANLLSNAAKFSEPGGRVELSLERSGDQLRFSVKDDGKGIPAGFRDRIFDRFAQADSTDRREVGGTGLGLAISKSIIDAHGGQIDFVSEEGKGSTFFFELRAVDRGRNDGE